MRATGTSTLVRGIVAIAIVVSVGAPVASAAAARGSAAGALGVSGRAVSGPVDDLPPSPADPSRPVTDPALIASIGRAVTDRPARGQRVPMVGVEVLTSYSEAVERTVAGLGGAVTGSVDGHVVQARMPATAAD